jgi:hypothetical protein
VISLPSVWLSSVAGLSYDFSSARQCCSSDFSPLKASAERAPGHLSPRQLTVLSLLCVLKFFCDLVSCSSSLVLQ